ncbi:uncharacterized protein B4U79_02998, partial [Dinothrombium tinctorium]
LLNITQKFSNEIKMEFGIDKCAVIHLKRGKFDESQGFKIDEETFIEALTENRTYKYFDNGKCRLCKTADESLNHLLAGYSTLARTDYLARHNQVAKIIYQQIAKRCGLLRSYPSYYKFNPAPVLENEKYTLYWDKEVRTDKTIDFDKPDIILIDKQKQFTQLIDVAVPLTQSIKHRKHENSKISKSGNRVQKNLEAKFSPNCPNNNISQRSHPKETQK